jgi:nicotinamidase-related amidase
MVTRGIRYLGAVFACAGLAACSTQPTQQVESVPSIPQIPAPVPVEVSAGSSALLVLDFNTQVCQPNPACLATLPAVSALIAKARAAKVPVVYSTTVNPAGPPPALAAVAPQPGEPTVVARANKFVDTNLEDLLKQRKASTLVVVGTAANGAVLYTTFHANVRGFTVVVAEDGISGFTPFATLFTRYQLLNQPGVSNPTNRPLAERVVTLSRTDMITFK